MFLIVADIINIIANILILLIFAYVILSWFMSPYNPVRESVDRIVEPMLAPIRRVVPLVGMFDLSPLILLILIELISRVLTSLLLSL
jgi:YggT family protein